MFPFILSDAHYKIEPKKMYSKCEPPASGMILLTRIYSLKLVNSDNTTKQQQQASTYSFVSIFNVFMAAVKHYGQVLIYVSPKTMTND